MSTMHTAMTEIAGKRVFITGGTSGIGRAIATLLGEQGAKIFICGRHQPALDEALKRIRSTGASADGALAGLSKAEDVKRIFQESDEALGGLDMFVANAGLGAGGVEDETEDAWRYVVETNLVGYISCAKEAMTRMKKAGSGHILFIGSLSSKERGAGSSIYVATKCGIEGFAEAFRKEVNPHGIKVSLIEPGAVGSDMQDESAKEQQERIEKMEMLRAEDIAVAAQYVLTQPARCDVIVLQIRPHLQLI